MNVESNNKFLDCHIGISIGGTFPIVSGMLVGNEAATFNQFAGNYVAIQSSGAEHPSGVIMENNKIEDTERISLYFHGANDVDLINNEISNSWFGLEAIGNGDNFNNYECNIFDEMGRSGLTFSGDNNNSGFLENLFTGVNTFNIEFWDNTSIKSNIGSASNPAMNCFDSQVRDVVVQNPNSLSSTTTYNYYSSSAQCQHEPNDWNGTSIPVNGIVHNPSNTQGDNCDDFIGIFGLIDPDDDGEDGILPGFTDTDICKGCIYPTIKIWITKVVDAGGDDPTTGAVESDPEPDPNLEYYEEVLDQWINFGLYASIQFDDISLAESILTPMRTYRWKKRLYGIKVLQSDFSAAYNLLQILPTVTTEQVYFKEVQEINLKRFILDPTNSIDEMDVQSLKQIGLTQYPASGYARSLYRSITGVGLPRIIVPSIKSLNNVKPRNSNDEENIMSRSLIYPNPSSDLIYISDKIDLTPSSIDLFDSYGNHCHSFSIKNNAIDISTLKEGMYFISLLGQEGKRIVEKFIVAR